MPSSSLTALWLAEGTPSISLARRFLARRNLHAVVVLINPLFKQDRFAAPVKATDIKFNLAIEWWKNLYRYDHQS